MIARDAIRRTRLRLPIRLKLAAVSAALTFVILLLFALVVGTFTERRLRDSFDDDLRATAADLQEQLRVRIVQGEPQLTVDDARVVRAAATGGATIRIVDRSGTQIARTGPGPSLGPPVESLITVFGYRVASRPLFAVSVEPDPFDLIQPPIGGAAAFVQYGKPETSVNATLARVRLFLALGVLGGTGLAFLAGFLVARRAMRPIAGLTRAAREVARTRDPAVTLPKPEANDEVADLAHTLEDMLRELGAARSEVETALARQRQFVADASHELRTPLTSILANLELLEAGLADGRATEGAPELDSAGEGAEMVRSALRSSRRMRRLVGDLLLLARADAGRKAPRTRLDLAAVVREATAETAPAATDHQVVVEADGPVALEGVPDDLHRLVANLVENALIHTPGGTQVRVAVRQEDGSALLEVADDGPGVPERMRARVFERFARGSTGAQGGGAPRTAAGGSGLGLAIVRAVAEGHGGEVGLDDAPGGGARFRVWLPAAADPAAAAAPAPGG